MKTKYHWTWNWNSSQYFQTFETPTISGSAVIWKQQHLNPLLNVTHLPTPRYHIEEAYKPIRCRSANQISKSLAGSIWKWIMNFSIPWNPNQCTLLVLIDFCPV